MPVRCDAQIRRPCRELEPRDAVSLCILPVILSHSIERVIGRSRYVYAAFAWMTIWTLIKLNMEHGFKPPEDPNKKQEPEGSEDSAGSEGAAKTDAGKAD